MMQLKLLFFLLYIPFVNQLKAQPLKKYMNYNIIVMGMKVGQFSVKQESDSNYINVEAITDVKVKLLLTYHVKYIQETTHHNGRLKKSHLQTQKNGKINSDTWLIEDDSDYLLIKDGDSTIIHDEITYTGSLLYFNEPIHATFLYKEKSGEKRVIKSTIDHTYVLLNEKGQVTHEYKFVNGIMAYAKIKYPIADILLEYVQ